MLVSDVQLVTTEGHCQSQARVESPALDEPFLLWYRVPRSLEAHLRVSGNPFLAALLLPAMSAGEGLEIRAPVSPRLSRSLEDIQSIYHCWNPRLACIAVEAPRADGNPPMASTAQESGLFFSLGVDSFYSLLKNVERHPGDEDTITRLILVHGFDVLVDKWNSDVYDSLLASAREVGRELGKEVIPVATNLRDLLDLFADWGSLGHGAALASVGLVLEGLFRTLRIAATYTYANLFPWGSHPLLDPLWSTEGLSVRHDGCEARRLDKLRLLARHAVALRTLRVCTDLTPVFNCGHCEKCLRTMIGLHVAGALQRCTTLPHAIDPQAVRRLAGTQTAFLEELLAELGDSPTDRALAGALEECLGRARALQGGAWAPPPATDLTWTRLLHKATRDLDALVLPEDLLILVDQEELREIVGTRRRTLPFLERDGVYWGPPDDDEMAIRELDRLRSAGARFVAFAWPGFWWLDHYAGFHRHLCDHFPCLLRNDRLVLFDLRPAQGR